MIAKQTIVKLTCDALGDREFEFEQANRLLVMKPNGGWRLPDDSDFQIGAYGLERRRNKEEDPRTGKKKVDQ